MQVVHAFEVPAKEALGGYLPNDRNPSDHLPVIADVAFAGTPAAEAAGATAGDQAPAAAAAQPAAAAAAADGAAPTGPTPVAVPVAATAASAAAAADAAGSAPTEAAAGAAPAAPATAAAHAPATGTAQSTEAHAAPDAAAASAPAAGNVFPADSAHAGRAAALLADGGVIAVPTDTLYGLAARCGDAAAIDAIYAIKDRARSTPLALSVAAVADVPAFGRADHLPDGLLAALLPGPVTVVLALRGGAPVAANLNPGMDTVAVRVPDAGFVREVGTASGPALVLTSANRSGEPSTVEIGQFSGLWGSISGVFDGGAIAGDARGSTIVDLSRPGGGYRVLREGSALDATAATLRQFGLAPAVPAEPVPC